MARAATPPAQAGDVRLSPAANDAVELVDAFAAALAAGQLEAARQFLAPTAVVVANGQIIGNRDAYIDGAAKADAAALRTVQRDVLSRKVDAGPDFGCVVSEKRVRALGDAKGRGRSGDRNHADRQDARGLEDHPHPLVGPARGLSPHRHRAVR